MGRKSNATLAAEAAAKEAAEKEAANKDETGDDDATDSNDDSSAGDQAGDQDSGGTGDSEGSETETPADGEDGSGDQTEGDESSDQTDSEEQGPQESTEAPVIASEAVEGEDLGDVTDSPVKALKLDSIEPEGDEEDFQTIHDQIDADDDTPAVVIPPYEYLIPDDFKPTLWPYRIKDEYIGFMQVPKVIFDLVQKPNWQEQIYMHSNKQGLISVLYWKRKNGHQVVRCMSSSKFADVV